MKTKNIVMLGVTALSLGAGLAATQTTASAATWHSSAIPTALRGTWHGKYTGQRLLIYRHTIRYSGVNTMTHVKWRYVGNHFYRVKGTIHEVGLSGSEPNQTSLIHYFNSHKITTMSMEHTFLR